MKHLLAFTLSALLATHASAADITTNHDGDGIILEGEIIFGDDVKLLELATELMGNGNVFQYVYLNSLGGNVATGIIMAEFVKAARVETVIDPGDVCASICVLVYAAGDTRWMYNSSQIGVHSPFTITNGQPTEDVNALAVTTLVARQMAIYGVPDTIIAKMVTTTGDSMTWLNHNDAPNWVTTLPDPE